ncbi:hypothetical protein NQ318_007328 [Aromia moschata]|uniref:acid phosphatase n=1 Tax=Aromia moschata TaxID=1265417 RepID=A0AAV8Z143_9CUCU|nr:hypothetical protein NQ318_007328 [Aromia moschata]
MTVTYADFFEYVTNYTGRNTTTLGNIGNLYSVFYVYRNHNASYIPDWGNSLDNETLAYLAGVHFTHSTLTDELKRLHTGPFFYYLTEYFDGIIGNTTDTPKFLMLSGHDTTIASVLNSMGAYDNWPPEFSSTVIWELYRANNETYYVNLLYKRNNDSDVEELVISGCKFDCDYDDFMAALEPYTVEYSIWEEECIPSDGNTQ